MTAIPDLVSDSRLETSFQNDGTIHIFSEVGPGRQRIRRTEHWKRIRHLGEGGFGRVSLEQCKEGKPKGALRAVKAVRKQRYCSRAIDYNLELLAVAKFSHSRYEACFVKSLGWYESEDAIFITMEYLPLGDLKAYLQHHNSKLPIEEACQITYQILEGLDYMHTNGFAHRDIKPSVSVHPLIAEMRNPLQLQLTPSTSQNIMIVSRPPENWWIKLTDLGISKRAEHESEPSTIKGTTGFMAPELQGFADESQGTRAPDFQAADMWAVGEVTYRMLSGEKAFRTPKAFAAYSTAQTPCPSLNLVPIAGEDAADLVTKLMIARPELRIKTAEALEHAWIETARAIPVTSDGYGTRSEEAVPQRCSPFEADDTAHHMGLTEASASWSEAFDMVEDERLGNLASRSGSTVSKPQMPTPPLPYKTTLPQSIADTDLNSVLTSMFRTIAAQDRAFPLDDSIAQMHVGSALRSRSDRLSLSRHDVDGSLLQDYGASPSLGLLDQDQAEEPPSRLDNLSLSKDVIYRFRLHGYGYPPSFGIDGLRQAYPLAAQVTPESWTIGLCFKTATSSKKRSALRTQETLARIAFSPDGIQLIIASRGYVRTRRTRSGLLKCETTIPELQLLANSEVVMSSGGEILARRLGPQVIGFQRLTEQHTTQELRMPDAGSIVTYTVSRDGTMLAAATTYTRIHVWETLSADLNLKLTPRQEGIHTVAFSPNGEFLASAALDHTIVLWHVKSGNTVWTLRGYHASPWHFAFSPDSSMLATLAGNNALRLRNTDAEGRIRTFEHKGGFVRSVAFSPDSEILASCDQTGFRLWRCRSTVPLRVPQKDDPRGVHKVAFSADGTTFATASEHGVVTIWDRLTGMAFRSAKCHEQKIHNIAFSPDGKTLASVSDDADVMIFFEAGNRHEDENRTSH